MKDSFRTVLKPEDSSLRISHQKNVVLMGSCFSANMEKKFRNAGFDVLANPFGIVYNPVPLFKSIELAFSRAELPESYIEELDSGFVNWLAHHTMQFNTKAEVLNHFNSKLTELKSTPEGSVIFLTLGTAWLYELNKEQFGVANCHKEPSARFNKRMASVHEIVDAGKKFIEQLKEFEVVFTVSPVRHLRDGFVENQRSKSVLHLAIKELEDRYANVHYFPSYELVLDDLRDYRFFNDDMLHPSIQAIDYVWDYLKESFLDENTLSLVKQSEQVHASSAHRPIHPKSDASRKHLETTLKKLQELENLGLNMTQARENLALHYPKTA